MRYIVIDSKAVDFDTKVAAHHALAAARKDLRLPDVYIKWFVRAGYESEYRDAVTAAFDMDESVNGMFNGKEPNTIYVQALQFEDAIKKTVYHETYHLFQRYKGYLLHENTAYEYMDDFAARMESSGEDDSVYLDHMAGKDWSESKGGKKNNHSNAGGEETLVPAIKAVFMDAEEQQKRSQIAEDARNYLNAKYCDF